MKEKVRKKIIVYGVLSLVAFTLVLGVSYAWMNLVVVGEKTQTITTDNISMRIQNEANEIQLEYAYPIQDEQGSKTIPYTFELENTGKKDLDIIVRLVQDEEALEQCKNENNGEECKKIPEEKLRYQLVK